MKKSDVLIKIQNFNNTLSRLSEAVPTAEDALDRDGVIQRFEFTIETLWKALKAILLYQGIECYSPRNCIKEAFQADLLPDEEIILDMLADRNTSAHLHDEAKSIEVFDRIKNTYLDYLQSLNLENKL